MLVFSPLVAEHARESCRCLGSHGGFITAKTEDGEPVYMASVVYIRSEGLAVPRVVHVEAADNTHRRHVFVLDEVSGEYTSGPRRLWPMRNMPHPLAVLIHRIPTAAIVDHIASFLVDTLPSPVPRYASQDLLRTHTLLAAANIDRWVDLWEGHTRPKQTSWDTRTHKRRRIR